VGLIALDLVIALEVSEVVEIIILRLGLSLCWLDAEILEDIVIIRLERFNRKL
jgi:hypothetical protein